MAWGDVEFEKPVGEDLVSRFRRSLPAATRFVGRALFVYAGVLVPIVSFAMAWNQPPNDPQWQSGALYAYLSYFLTYQAGFVFYPLMLYSMACFSLVLFWRERFSQSALARMGVYTGVLLGLHYSVLLCTSIIEASNWWQVLAAWPFQALFAILAGVIAAAIVQTLVLCAAWLWRRFGARPLVIIVLAIVIPSLLAAGSVLDAGELTSVVFSPFLIVFFISLLCGPFWFTAVYAYVSIDLLRRHWEGGQFRIWQMLLVFTWLASYLAACRAAMNLALIEYAKLPTEPPDNCYIATAAARGHPRLVRSWFVRTACGKVMRVNRQLQILKCGEIAIKTLSPGLHRGLRNVYDSLGPELARCLSQRLLADCTYLLLKPVEWTTARVLCLCLPNFPELADKMYRPRKSTDAP